MGSIHCRLYDEHLVHNIIMSAGLAVIEYLNDHQNADADDICEYLELHADSIIEETIEQLNSDEEYPNKDENSDSWEIPPPDHPDRE